MKKKSVWLAFGLVAVMTATAVTGALAFSDGSLLATATETEEAQTETAAPEAEETAATEAAESETAEDTTETEAETESATEAETETETEEDEETSFVAVAYQEEDAWSQVAIINSAYVETGVNIRSAADTESEVLGYLYVGTAVWVIERGDVWTQFYSNGITGYVMSDYLLYGSDVAEIAEVYGAEGVRADWDGVSIYTSDDGATVKDTMDAGDVYQVVNDYGHWIEILYDEDTTAFVSSDDVTSVMLFEGATPKDEERVQLEKLYGVIWPEAEETVTYAETEAASTSSSDSSGTTSGSTSSGSSSSSSSSSGSSSSGSSSSGSSSSSSSSSGSSSSGSTSSGSTSSSSSSETTSTETASTESSSSSSGESYYDADTDTYYDENGNAVTSSYEAETTASTEAETTASTEAETTASTEAAAAAVSETEAAETTTSSTTDDTTLLAALIYCEAGNQSYEGMVAVGAVVMNRVASSSFPNSISEVIYQSGQFSPASSGALAKAIANGVPSTCYTAASAAIGGEDPTGGALYFNTTANKGVQIGDHWFY